MPTPSPDAATRRRMTTADKIVLYWLGLFVLAVPAAFAGWRYLGGVIAGMLGVGLWTWRYKR